MKFKLTQIVSALRLAAQRGNEMARVEFLIRDFWPKRAHPGSRWYLRQQIARLRALRRNQWNGSSY